LVVFGDHSPLLCQQVLHIADSWFRCNDKARYKCKYMHWRVNERRDSNEWMFIWQLALMNEVAGSNNSYKPITK
jgi:hypothetical protein